ncbi:MAG: AsnC family transcriptional regulator [Nanoarchaeota archaeon]|nr:AsnC family transcriptional regulator [Nanoarchaeota archaeon]
MGKIDYGLIYFLSQNSRISLKELSTYLRKSSQRLKYSIYALNKENILGKPYCIFDYSYFGLVLFRVYFRGAYINNQDKEHIIRELENNPYVNSIYEFTGEFDLTVEFASPNPSKFNKELKKLSESIPTLNDYKIILNFVTYIFPNRYLVRYINRTDSLQSTEKIIGGDREMEKFSNNEMKVMKNLLLYPNIRLTKLAKKAELNVQTVKSVMKSLMKRNIIRGFKYIVNTNKLGINKCRLFIKLHNLNIERESKLMEFIIKTKEIVQINKTVGDWDLELDIESLDKDKIKYTLLNLREGFKELIERFNIMDFYSYYKKTYLPLSVFTEPVAIQKVFEQT